MSKGHDSRTPAERGERSREGSRGTPARSSRTSIPMTTERARAIQAKADRTGTDPDFKARAMSAAARNSEENKDSKAPPDGQKK